MRRICLTLMVVFALACAADPESKADDPAPTTPPPAESVTTPAGTGADSSDKVSLVGGSKVGLIKPDDWKRIDRFTEMFYSGELESLHAEFSEAARTELPLDALTAMRAGLLAEHGEEVEIVNTTKEEKDGYRAYKRAARFSRDSRLIEVAWVIGPDEAIAGLFVTPDRSASQ